MVEQLIHKYADAGINFLEAAILFVVGWYVVKMILRILSNIIDHQTHLFYCSNL